jgi:hypothetical protein
MNTQRTHNLICYVICLILNMLNDTVTDVGPILIIMFKTLDTSMPPGAPNVFSVLGFNFRTCPGLSDPIISYSLG